ncbi:NACHT domain-containing protein [Streptomyces canus]|uniref:NACHT domain-containing protein n=1 Tax=Streptomyces canus TaxID=58343 RepID=UPI00324343EB
MNKLQTYTGRDWLRWALQLGGGGWLVYTLAVNGLAKADPVASVLSCLVAVLPSLIQAKRTKPDLDKVLSDLRMDVKRYWTRERKRRNLSQSQLLPITVTNSSAFPSTIVPTSSGLWSYEQYGDEVARLLADGQLPSRAMILGEAGAGKTTFAVMLTNGLARRGGYVPLYFSLASWSPADERFPEWFQRQALTTYPGLREILPAPEPLVRELLLSDQVLLILDGLDELRNRGAQDVALAQIEECIDDDMPVLVLARVDPPPPLLPQAARLTLELVPRDGVIAYLNALTAGIIADPTVPLEHRIAWRRVRNLFTSGGSAALTYLLSRPLYLDLLVRTGLHDTSLPVRFLDAVRHGREAGKKVLYTSFVDDALGARSDFSHRRARLARRLAFQMAKEMSRTPTLTMAWWRLYMRVPPPVFGAAMAPLTAPAYQLCLFMPAGMTRGFALGTVTGVVLGMCRGVNTRSPACVTAAVAGSGAAIMAVGTVWVGWRIAVVDTVEIAPAVGLVFRARQRLAADSWRSVTATVAAAGVGSAVMTCAAAAALAPDADPPRSLSGVFMAVCMGLGVATVSARLLTSPHADLNPATATFQLRGNPLPHLVAASTAAAAVAVAGGFVGGWSRGWTHGEHVGLFFGTVVGPGIGLAGGLIRWLNQPGPEKTATAQRLYRHDRWLAVLSVVAVAAGATTSLAVLAAVRAPFLHSLSGNSFTASPVNGILFGATIGVIVAAFNTAWPNYVVCMIWFTVRYRMPWSLLRHLDALHTCNILRQDGSLYSFRDEGLQLHLAG